MLMIDLPLPQTLEEFVESSRPYFEPQPPAGVMFDGDAPPAPVPMLLPGLVPAAGLTFLGGQSGAGKTFVAVDAAVALASRGKFFNRAVSERVGVIYLAAEGGATIATRIAAAKAARGIGENLPIAIVTSAPDLSETSARKKFVDTLAATDRYLQSRFDVRTGAVILDTLVAAFSMKDENSAAEIASVCKSAAELGAAVNAATIVLHHYGKSAETGLRGSSALRAAGDSIIAVIADRDETSGRCTNRRLVLAKSRVGEEGPVASFSLDFVHLGIDDAGAPHGAAHVKLDEGATNASPPPSRAKRLTRSTRAYLDAIEEALNHAGEKCRPFPDGPEVHAVEREAIRAAFYPRWPADGEDAKAKAAARRQSFNRGEADAFNQKLAATIEVDDRQLVWKITPPPLCERDMTEPF